jgi:hypothetical protein
MQHGQNPHSRGQGRRDSLKQLLDKKDTMGYLESNDGATSTYGNLWQEMTLYPSILLIT